MKFKFLKTIEVSEADASIPVYKLTTPQDVTDFFRDDDGQLHEHVYQGVMKGVKEHLDFTPVYKLQGPSGSLVIGLEHDAYAAVLQTCLFYFEDNEEYEKCADIKSVLE